MVRHYRDEDIAPSSDNERGSYPSSKGVWKSFICHFVCISKHPDLEAIRFIDLQKEKGRMTVCKNDETMSYFR